MIQKSADLVYLSAEAWIHLSISYMIEEYCDQTEIWGSSKSYRISIPTSGHIQGVQHTVVFSGYVFRTSRYLL